MHCKIQSFGIAIWLPGFAKIRVCMRTSIVLVNIQWRDRANASRLTLLHSCYRITYNIAPGGAVAQLGARLDGIEEVAGSNPAGSTTSKIGSL